MLEAPGLVLDEDDPVHVAEGVGASRHLLGHSTPVDPGDSPAGREVAPGRRLVDPRIAGIEASVDSIVQFAHGPILRAGWPPRPGVNEIGSTSIVRPAF